VQKKIAKMKLVAYLKDTYNELMNKVTWPTWEELQESAILVMIASAIFALVIALLDVAFKNALGEIYKILF
jgi:preprotein translocase subunit SecE